MSIEKSYKSIRKNLILKIFDFIFFTIFLFNDFVSNTFSTQFIVCAHLIKVYEFG